MAKISFFVVFWKKTINSCWFSVDLLFNQIYLIMMFLCINRVKMKKKFFPWKTLTFEIKNQVKFNSKVGVCICNIITYHCNRMCFWNQSNGINLASREMFISRFMSQLKRPQAKFKKKPYHILNYLRFVFYQFLQSIDPSIEAPLVLWEITWK